jgi:hypothetical protein
MKSGTKRLLSGIAVAAGTVGATVALLKKRNMQLRRKPDRKTVNVWARPGMLVTFRAELRPGRERDDRTFRIKELLPSGRVLLHGVDGEHAEGEFERIQ